MKSTAFLIIGAKGIRELRKTKPPLKWDELAVKVSVDIPDVLFKRPLLEATIKVDESIMPETIIPQLIINTKELIEQQTGAKIDFKVIEVSENKDAIPEPEQQKGKS